MLSCLLLAHKSLSPRATTRQVAGGLRSCCACLQLAVVELQCKSKVIISIFKVSTFLNVEELPTKPCSLRYFC